MPEPQSGETRDDYLSRCIPVVMEEGKEQEQAIAICNSLWEKNRMSELKKQIITNHKSARGIVTADSYFRGIEECFGNGFCPTKLFQKATEEEWKKHLEDASQLLAYQDPDARVLKHRRKDKENTGGGGAILTFDAIVTSNRRDRDFDVMETKGAKLDPKAPLLWQHTPMEPIGKVLRVIKQTDSQLICRHAIADTQLGRDAAVLVEMDALRVSHGFEPEEAEPLDDAGWHIKKYTILEVSLVSIPSNEDAIITAYSRGKLHHPFVKGYAKARWDAQKIHAGADIPCSCDTKKKNKATEKQVESAKYYGALPQSWEAIEGALRNQLNGFFGFVVDGGIAVEQPYAWLIATFPNYVLAEVYQNGETRQYRVSWTMEGEDPKLIGEPQPVKLQMQVVDEIAKARRAILQQKGFCPTGEGGGIDNSCSPGEGGGGKEIDSYEMLQEGDYLSGKEVASIVREAGLKVDGNRTSGMSARVRADSSDALRSTLQDSGWKYEGSDTQSDAGTIIDVYSRGDMMLSFDYSDSGDDERFPIQVSRKREKSSKAGRIISSKNEEALREAQEDLTEAAKIEGVPRACKSLISSAAARIKTVLETLEMRNQMREDGKGFCPTGEGGGIDNSCGSGEGGGADVGGMADEYEAEVDRVLGHPSSTAVHVREVISEFEEKLDAKLEEDFPDGHPLMDSALPDLRALVHPTARLSRAELRQGFQDALKIIREELGEGKSHKANSPLDIDWDQLTLEDLGQIKHLATVKLDARETREVEEFVMDRFLEDLVGI